MINFNSLLSSVVSSRAVLVSPTDVATLGNFAVVYLVMARLRSTAMITIMAISSLVLFDFDSYFLT